MEKMLFIYNPHAGKGQVRNKLADVLNAFTRAGALITAYPTQGPGDAIRAARELAPFYDRIAVCGGDGTLHEVVNGLMALPMDHRPLLGYLPTGTTNDFAQNLNLPKYMEDMAALAATGQGKAVDVGLLGDQYFVYVAAFGLFTDVAYSTPQNVKNAIGHAAYVLRGVAELGNMKSYHLKITHDGEELEGEFLYGMVSNTISVGGLIGLPSDEVALDDGELEVILIPTPKTVAELNMVIRGLARQEYTPESGILGFHTSRLSISCAEPVPFTLDGEYGGEHTEADITAVYQAIDIICGT